MQMKPLAAVLVAGIVAGGCAVHQTEEPALAGPSELANAVEVTATPDTIKLGMSPIAPGESSQIVVRVMGPGGAAVANRSVRVDVVVGQSFADCGQLALRDFVTGSDGRAATVFTAPTQPLPQPECTNFAPGGTISIVATPAGTNYQTSSQRAATIRMIMPTVIQPPGAPTVSFTISPTTAKVGAEVSFGDAGSYAAAGRTIVSFHWDFSDGISKTGAFVQHDFAAPGTYTATLTVTDDLGNQSSKSATIAITP